VGSIIKKLQHIGWYVICVSDFVRVGKKSINIIDYCNHRYCSSAKYFVLQATVF